MRSSRVPPSLCSRLSCHPQHIAFVRTFTGSSQSHGPRAAMISTRLNSRMSRHSRRIPHGRLAAPGSRHRRRHLGDERRREQSNPADCQRWRHRRLSNLVTRRKQDHLLHPTGQLWVMIQTVSDRQSLSQIRRALEHLHTSGGRRTVRSSLPRAQSTLRSISSTSTARTSERPPRTSAIRSGIRTGYL